MYGDMSDMSKKDNIAYKLKLTLLGSYSSKCYWGVEWPFYEHGNKGSIQVTQIGRLLLQLFA